MSNFINSAIEKDDKIYYMTKNLIAPFEAEYSYDEDFYFTQAKIFFRKYDEGDLINPIDIQRTLSLGYPHCLKIFSWFESQNFIDKKNREFKKRKILLSRSKYNKIFNIKTGA